MKRVDTEIKRAEIVNSSGVKTLNRLIVCRQIFESSGRVYSTEYYWVQDVTQPDGSTLISQIAHYKRYSAMKNAMDKYNFDLK